MSFSSSLVFSNLIITCHGIFFLMFLVLGNSWICTFIILSDLKNFLPLFLQILFSVPPLSFEDFSYTCGRLLEFVSQLTDARFIFFNSVFSVSFGKFLLLCLQVH